MSFQCRHFPRGSSLIILMECIVYYLLLNTGLHSLCPIVMPALNNVEFHTCVSKIILFSDCYICLPILETIPGSDVLLKWKKKSQQ